MALPGKVVIAEIREKQVRPSSPEGSCLMLGYCEAGSSPLLAIEAGRKTLGGSKHRASLGVCLRT